MAVSVIVVLEGVSAIRGVEDTFPHHAVEQRGEETCVTKGN